jgi:hypothetical protein
MAKKTSKKAAKKKRPPKGPYLPIEPPFDVTVPKKPKA